MQILSLYYLFIVPHLSGIQWGEKSCRAKSLSDLILNIQHMILNLLNLKLLSNCTTKPLILQKALTSLEWLPNQVLLTCLLIMDVIERRYSPPNDNKQWFKMNKNFKDSNSRGPKSAVLNFSCWNEIFISKQKKLHLYLLCEFEKIEKVKLCLSWQDPFTTEKMNVGRGD